MMQFAVPVPWWTLMLAAASVAGIAWASYRAHNSSLGLTRRAALVTLRAATLLVLVACLLRPVRVLPPDAAADVAVPILVDVSRSMSLEDVEGRSRLEAARALVDRELRPTLRQRFAPEVWTFGDGLHRVTGDVTANADATPWTAAARRSDLAGALRQVQERYRDRRLAAIVVVSDGGDTGAADTAASLDDAVPVYTVGIGPSKAGLDYEVLDVAAGEAAVTDATVDITVAAVGRGSAAPFDIRLLQNGNPIDVRHVVPRGADSPVQTVFTVSPSTDAATLYTVEIPAASAEAVAANNRRSIAVAPPGRPRRILIIEGAPGFEHSFLKRALNADRALEVDSVVRKGRDASGQSTYFVQAPGGRAPLLLEGFPKDRTALYTYDAVILANVEPDALTGQQLEQLAAFVGQRGGGLLVLGAKALGRQGLSATPIEEVLPVALAPRSSDIVRTAGASSQRFGLSLTPDGIAHPAMRIAGSDDEVTKRWKAVPALAAASPLGAPRPGAQVLAVVRTADGQRPLVAVQRYGQGRSMVFAGEASWRWRMTMPSTDRTYEMFWRHAARWLSSSAPERATIADVPAPLPGDQVTIATEVRDAEFKPIAGAVVGLRISSPSGTTTEARAALADAASGRYSADVRFEEAGLYRISADVRSGAETLLTERSILVGALDREMSNPRLNDEVLRRVSRVSGGTYLAAGEAQKLAGLLTSTETIPETPRVQELWHSIWVFVVLVTLLSGEWMLRRTWGLR
jgi:uncharacterized membrane protein